MHRSVLNEMKSIVKAHGLNDGRSVLDFGSLDVDGSYRDLFPKGSYEGIDLRNGKNVDWTMDSEFKTPFKAGVYDAVISGSCIEHCRNPFLLVQEMRRVVKVGGMVVINAPFIWHEHKHPIDCFRYLPDGMRALFDFAGLYTINAYLIEKDCWGIAEKKRKVSK